MKRDELANDPASKRWPMRALAGAIASVVGATMAVASTAAPQAAYTVSNCTDHDPGSLRDVIASVPDGSTIIMGGACTPITLQSALVVNQNSLTINLHFSNRYEMVLDAGHRDRVIFHTGSGKLSLRDMTISNGAASLDSGLVVGGCIWSQGAVELVDSIVSGCELTTKDGTALGGGVYAHSGLYLTDATLTGNLAWANGSGSAKGGGAYSKQRLYAHYSTISGNSAKYDTHNAVASSGGGLYAASIVTIQGSVIDNNKAAIGGGIEIHSDGGSATVGHLVNSTISGNTATNGGGGIATNAIIEIDNGTIAFNAAQSSSGGGGVLVGGSEPIGLYSTIIADNSAPGGAKYDANLGSASSANVYGDHDLIISANAALPAGTLRVDPKLQPLRDNGGATRTHAVVAGSAAIDAGSNRQNLGNDQRGPCGLTFRRNVGAGTDIGAFEWQGPGDGETIFKDGFEIAQILGCLH